MGRITIDEAPAWVKRLEGELRKAGERGLVSAAHRLVGVIQNEIIPRESRIPVDRGIYKAGWRARKIPRGAFVYNSVPHAPIIEYGARAENIKVGRKMIDALAQWVIRKGLTGAAKKEERSVEAKRIAWAIAKSMQKNGIFDKGRGLRILEKACARVPEIIEQEVRAEIHRMRRA
jgi:hypothetical protein